MSFPSQYHDSPLAVSYHYNNRQIEYSNSHDSLQALTPPSDEVFKTSPWTCSSNTLITNDVDGEEVSQPERGIAGFVSKLYQCLQAPDDGQKYVRWCKRNGIDMFIIDCIPKFTEIVLPKLFKHCKFASFVRQLNIYGFQRDTDARKSKDSRDKETCRWHHIHFRPGRHDLFHLIRRKTPMYSRRKRARTEEEEEDPDTILNVGSGDESDTILKESDENDEHDSMNSFNHRRLSSSSVSSLPSTLQHLPQDSNNNLYDYNAHEDKLATYHQFYQEPQDISLNQFGFYNHSSNMATSSSTLSHQQPIVSSPNPALIEDQSLSQFQANALPEHFLHEQAQSSLLMEQTVENSNTPSQLIQESVTEQLRLQIVDLRKEYTRMYKILTGEVNKASNIIDVQRARIELLENSLRQQQDLKLASQPFMDSNNSAYFPTVSSQQPTTEFLRINTAPPTPIYPQAFSNRQHESFLSYDDSITASPLQTQSYPVLFQQKDELSHCISSLELSSPCVSNHLADKWMTPPYPTN